MNTKPKVRQFIKITIGILLLVSLVYQFSKLEIGFTELQVLKQSFAKQWGLLLICIFLMPLNWLTECLKWYMTMSVSHKIRWTTVIKSVMMGISVSLITPNRIGEYFGRVAGIDSEIRHSGILTTLLGGLAQNLITWTIGLLAVLYLLNQQIEFTAYFNASYTTLALLVILVGFIVFFRIGQVKRLFVLLANRFQQLQPYAEVFDILDKQGLNMLLKLLVLSGLRYLLYMIQYVLLIYFVGISCPLSFAFAGVGFIFFIQASMPLPAGLGLMMRGNVSLLVWGTLCNEPVLGVASSYMLFIINFSLTAFLGVYFFFKSDMSLKQVYHAKNSQ